MNKKSKTRVSGFIYVGSGRGFSYRLRRVIKLTTAEMRNIIAARKKRMK